LLLINKRLDYLGWQDFELDEHTYQWAMACFEGDHVDISESIFLWGKRWRPLDIRQNMVSSMKASQRYQPNVSVGWTDLISCLNTTAMEE